jgi:hypothetical protein
MERVEEIVRDGKTILYIDFSGFTSHEQFKEVIETWRPIISRYPEHSVYTITNVENIIFDTAVKEIVIGHMSFNKPYVKGGAVIGMDGIKKMMIKTIMNVSKRPDLEFFFTKEEAVNWILQQG